MEYIRIGEKVISISKIKRVIDEIINLRCKGYSQQEAAKILNIDRTFISRLEGMGEIRKGGGIAVIGFPVKNKDELYTLLSKKGIDYILLMTEKERMDYVNDHGGQELFNDVLKILSEIRKYQHCIIIGSNMRTKSLPSLFDGNVYTIEIGQSPLKQDVYVDPGRVMDIIDMIKE